MAEALMEDVGTLPKDLLVFIEMKAERAIEVLREIVTEPEYQSAASAQGFLGGALAQGFGQNGLNNQLANQQMQRAIPANWGSDSGTAGITITGVFNG